MALALAADEGSVTHQRLMQVAEGHPRDLTLLFQSLIRKGMLERDRPGRGCTYHLPGARPAASSPPMLDLPLFAEAGSAQNVADSTQSSAQSAPGSALSPAVRGDTRVDSGRPEDAKWLPRTAIREAVLLACRGQFLSIAELATLLHRAPRTVQQNYVRPLLAEGVLELRHPDVPNHPEQAYRTVGDVA